MPKHESEIQQSIIDAVQLFFMSSDFGLNIPYEDIRIVTPPAGGQAKEVSDFGRKPYDVAFYAIDTIVLFFEIKERDKSGKVSEFKNTQRDMLLTLAGNGVDIRYAYNSWDFRWGERLTPIEVLRQAHVRQAKDMGNPINVNPILPAQILLEYLYEATSRGGQTLVDVLGSDIRQIDNLNSMPLMILANLDPQNARVLIDRAPSGALRIMKNLFDLPSDQRNSTLGQYSLHANGQALQSMARAIFSMKDNWSIFSHKKMRP
jgi:hypothetical protein